MSFLFAAPYQETFCTLCHLHSKNGNKEHITMLPSLPPKNTFLFSPNTVSNVFLKPPKSIIASFLQPTPTFPIGISFYCSIFLLKKLKIMRKQKVESEESKKELASWIFAVFTSKYVVRSHFLVSLQKCTEHREENGWRIIVAEKCVGKEGWSKKLGVLNLREKFIETIY